MRGRLPAGANKLAIAVGHKMRLTRLSRHLTVEQASEKLAITIGHYRYLEHGRVLPSASLAQRIKAWMVDNISFEGAAPCDAMSPHVQGKLTRIVKAFLPKPLATQFARKCESLGMSQAATLHLLVRNFVRDRVLYSTLAEAAKEVQEVRALAALEEMPALRDLLAVDLALLERLNLPEIHWRAKEARPLELPSVREIERALIGPIGAQDDELEEV